MQPSVDNLLSSVLSSGISLSGYTPQMLQLAIYYYLLMWCVSLRPLMFSNASLPLLGVATHRIT